ncbi:hypothetical protein H257_11760 [Aphanomyces astaci]|uniref:RING-type domain-containing protein n=1 Tax=Aphanomyces astaci TaxID=112090 RepID=W4G1S7_APHAT|nr:hypothetical protein H257_11760 [Aphanomyces astaci]ETV73657.1 hypothetical protein H257_11760 [Aphanomyces astaci]|eukprot:XP_009837083.1 hypothetical protein H257_11760 [Aphanomyces astaci]
MEPAPQDDAGESEPLLKYERVGGHLHTLLRDDALSCIAGHMNFICVGTFSGHVLMLELNGRYIRRLHQHHKRVHEISIDESGQHIVSCSDDGTVAVYALLPMSTELDASRVVIPTSGGEVNIYNFYNAVYSSQLEPGYATKRERSFACGGISGQLIVNKKGWIIDKENTVHEGEGPVHCIRYHDHLLAWVNDWGVKVYDTATDTRVTYIERPPNCPPLELCRAHLVWHTLTSGDLVLLVGWGHTLRVVKFTASTSSTSSNDDTTTTPPATTPPSKATPAVVFGSAALSAEVVSYVTFDFFVAGVSPWGDSAVCVLAFRPPGSASSTPLPSTPSVSRQGQKETGEGLVEATPCPEMHVIDWRGTQMAVDMLPLRGFEKLRATDYHALCLTFPRHTTNSPVLFLCTPKDVVVCRVRDVDDRVAYALSQRAYENALAIALTDVPSLKRHALDELVEYYLGELVLSQQYATAADVCRRLLSPHLWEKYVYVFAQKGQLSAIAKFMPTSNPRLPTSQYEMVLKHFLDTDPAQLLQIIRKWPKPRMSDRRPSSNGNSNSNGNGIVAAEYTKTASLFDPLYDSSAWILQLETVVRRRRLAETDVDRMTMETSYLMEALAELYTATEQYDNALRIYLSQGSLCTNKDHAFKLIVEHNLWDSIQNKVVNLMLIDRESALRMLVHQIKSDQLKVHAIVKQLEHKKELLHEYLHSLVVHRLADYNAEMYASLHELQISLYAEFMPSYLVKFLQTSAFVPLEKAYQFCSERSPPLWDAMIFILGRMGQQKKALDFILTQLQNVKQAIQFVQDNGDELWDYLVEISLTNRGYIEELLEYASDHQIDPIKIMRKIPDDMEITGLKAKVQQIIANYRIQLSLCHGCTKAFEADRVELLGRLVTHRRKARRVSPVTSCGVCFTPMKPIPNKSTHQFCVFECGHTYHMECLEEKSMLWKQPPHDSMDLRCFQCDHSTLRMAAPTASGAAAKGLTDQQLELARLTIAQG